MFVEQKLNGWGRYSSSWGRVYRPEKLALAASIIKSQEQLSFVGRGQGRSYGDAALNLDQGLVLTQRLNRFLSFDPATGCLECEAGVTLEEILTVFVPRGWFLPVTPGTKFASIGGCVACDVHGKNHHKDGSLGNSIGAIEVLQGQGEVVRCSPVEQPELFWATIGGMGLTGLIVAVKLRLRPIETAFIKVDYERAGNLEEAVGLMEEGDAGYDYSVAWMDCVAGGKSLGRSVLIRGNHAGRSELRPELASAPLNAPPRSSWNLPVDLPAFTLNPLSLRVLNSLYFGRSSRVKSSVVLDYDRFFYPLDTVRQWNRMYGGRGFLQYQCVIPAENSLAALTAVLKQLRSSRCTFFLGVLKRFGRGNGYLSFPLNEFTLSLDLPMKGDRLLTCLEQVDDLVIRHGGRVYLAKDARLSPRSFRQMYPDFPKWQQIKREVDPSNRFSSDLSRRLELTA